MAYFEIYKMIDIKFKDICMLKRHFKKNCKSFYLAVKHTCKIVLLRHLENVKDVTEEILRSSLNQTR